MLRSKWPGAFTGRDRVAMCANLSKVAGTPTRFICTTPMSAGIPRAYHELTASFRYNDLNSVEALLKSAPGEFAALVLEAETTVPPEARVLRGPSNSVRSGMAPSSFSMRSSPASGGTRRGAQFVHGIKPDLCTLGKGLANGLPLSALLGRREIMDLGGFAGDRDRVLPALTDLRGPAMGARGHVGGDRRVRE